MPGKPVPRKYLSPGAEALGHKKHSLIVVISEEDFLQLREAARADGLPGGISALARTMIEKGLANRPDFTYLGELAAAELEASAEQDKARTADLRRIAGEQGIGPDA